MMTYKKLSDTEVEVTDTTTNKRTYTKEELLIWKANKEADLTEINNMLKLLP